MFGGERCAQRRHRAREPGLLHGDHVHVALDHDQVAAAGAVFQRLAGQIQAVQQLALPEGVGFRRVEILGLLVAQHPAPEAAQAAQMVADGEHHPAPEAVINAPRLDVLTHQACVEQLPLVHAARLGPLEQPVPAVRGVAQLEPLDGFVAQSAPPEVVQARAAQIFPEVRQRKGVHVVQVAGSLLAVARLDGHARLVGEFPQRVAEAQVLLALHEREHVAARLAAETVEIALLDVHLKTGRLLLVKRTQPFQAASPGGRELHVLSDHVGNIDPLTDLFFTSHAFPPGFTSPLGESHPARSLA